VSYRCTNAFWFNNKIYSGGAQVADNDPILKSHGDSFTKVREEVAAKATETATSAPGEQRTHVHVADEPKRGRGQSPSDKKTTNPKSEETGS
jgi:hypothetical protein